ncbi:MAG: hypothetical protein LBH04_07345 [Tannerellaceae bacterium]|nr:hypothetical protein [Tannerellaceae bacterium]
MKKQIKYLSIHYPSPADARFALQLFVKQILTLNNSLTTSFVSAIKEAVPRLKTLPGLIGRFFASDVCFCIALEPKESNRKFVSRTVFAKNNIKIQTFGGGGL